MQEIERDMKCNLAQICMVLFFIGSNFVSFRSPRINQNDSPINVDFIPLTGTTLEALISGEEGEGLLVFSPRAAPSTYNLAVRLSNQADPHITRAEILQIPDNISEGNLTDLANRILDLPPSILIESLDGWWVKDSIPSYNLNIQVRGQINAIWGTAEQSTSSQGGWSPGVAVGQPTVYIIVRDDDHDGLPDWELRSLLPIQPGRGDIKGNYTERKCETPVDVDMGIFPLWPYLSIRGGYEQLPGKFRPPIVIDPVTGSITYFSELVTARNQNCAYSLYTIDPLTTRDVNRTNFEAPFAIYDLSGEGRGYPNLVIRTEHYPVGDRWFSQFTRDFETVRYSWRNAVGDQRWDYKVEVAGFYPYHYRTPLAGNRLLVDAPGYDEYPSWVIDRSWPAVTFIATNGNLDLSSEGIYTWSPRDLGDAYLRGETDQSNPGAFSTLKPGLQGEYRFTRDLPPVLYASRIDKQLHLLGAEGGMINLGGDQFLREFNLDGDLFIDSWFLEENDCKFLGISALHCQRKISAAVYAVGDYLLYSGASQVEILPFNFSPVMFEVVPPTDPHSWTAFIEHVETLDAKKADLRNLHSWLNNSKGQTMKLSGASISNISISTTGFQFLLELQPGYWVSPENQLFPINGLPSGIYLVHYDGKFRLKTSPLTEASLEIHDSSLDVLHAIPGIVTIVITNNGDTTLHDSTLSISLQGGLQEEKMQWRLDDLEPGKYEQFLAICPQIHEIDCQVHGVLEGENGKIIAEQSQLFQIKTGDKFRSNPLNLILSSTSSLPTIGLVAILLILLFMSIARMIRAN